MKKILVRRYLSDLPGYTHPKILGDQNRFTIPNDHREKTVLPAAALPLGVRESSFFVPVAFSPTRQWFLPRKVLAFF
jgi:hypothetical protein